jgi:hypothetical protein
MILLSQTSVAVSNIKSQLLPKFCGSKQAQQQESSWRLESHLEENVSPVSNVRLLQRNGCLDPRIIRRLTGPRVSRIPDRICGRATSYWTSLQLSLTRFCFCIVFASIQKVQWFPCIYSHVKSVAGNLAQGFEPSSMLIDGSYMERLRYTPCCNCNYYNK